MTTSPVTIQKIPLTPQIMQQSGVPLEDALWFKRTPSLREQMAKLATARGEQILVRVRKFVLQESASHAFPMGA